ncbi:MAG: ATP synthase F1 subunit delta, partial [Rhodospirillaceae bacterium]|nr:ATP synthase F1 subunit delta [Rhodospirillaceae bacterium]
EMIQAFQLLLAKNRGELFGEVTSSHSLEKKQIEKIKSELEKVSGKKFRLKIKVDSSLIGGVLIKVGSTMIDSSIRTKLRNLSNVMKGSG